MTRNCRRLPLRAGLWAGAAVVSLGTVGLARAATELADAAMNGDAKAVETLLEQHVDVNASQADGATALQWAVYRGDVATARALVKAGASVTQANRDGATPLSLACETGNPELVRLLLDSGADANETLPHGETALMMAARTGNTDTLALSGRARRERERNREPTRHYAADVGGRVRAPRGCRVAARAGRRRRGAVEGDPSRPAAVPRADRAEPPQRVREGDRPGRPASSVAFGAR